MATAQAVDVDLAIMVPERLLIAAADTLPGWLRQETLGTPKVPSYQADRRELGVWEFRAGRGYFELEHYPALQAIERDHIELAVRVIDGAVYAGVRSEIAGTLSAETIGVITAIEFNSGGLLKAGLLKQLHASAEGSGRGLKTVDIPRTRRLYAALERAVQS